MADMRFSTFNGAGLGASVSASATSPSYTNRGYLTSERSPNSYTVGGVGGGGVALSRQSDDMLMAHDASYPEYATGSRGGGGVQYTKEYRTETRTVETKKPATGQIHASVDLSSPFSLGGDASVDVGYGGGYVGNTGGYQAPPKSPGAASSGSRRLVAQSEQLEYRVHPSTQLFQQHDGQDFDDHDVAYENLPAAPAPPPPQRSGRGGGGSTTSSRVGPLSPQLSVSYGNGGSASRGGPGFEFSVAGGARYGSSSNVSGPRSPQYVNGGGGGGINYGYSVTMETNTSRSGTNRPSIGGDRVSLHASQASGLDWTARQEQELRDQQEQQHQHQQQYVNYRELRDAPDGFGVDVGGGMSAGVTLTRSDKFGSLGSISAAGSGNVRAQGSASMTLRSQGSGSGGAGVGVGGYGLSVRDIDLQDSGAAAGAAAGASIAMSTTVQESHQQMQRSVQQTRHVETSGDTSGGVVGFRDPGMIDLVAYLRSDSDVTVLNATAFIQHVTYADNDAKAEFFRLGGLPQLLALLQAAVGGARGAGSGFDLLRNLLGIVRNITFKSNEDDRKPRDAQAEQELNRNLEDLKREICRLGVLKLLREVVAVNRDEDAREIACAAIWNLSSTPDLKPDVIEACADTLVTTVLLPHSGLEMRGDSYVSVHQPMHTTFLFYLASGVLRSVSSAAGERWRDRLRGTLGLPDSLLWPLLSAQSSQLELNQPGLENCLCVVRNLAFACQEVADPGYLRRQQEAAKAAAAGGVGKKKSPLACCGGQSGNDPPPSSSKQQKQQPKQNQKQKQADKGANKSDASAPIIQRRMPNPIHGMDRLWYPTDMAPLLQHLLDTCARPQMLEAAAGTVQNLAACSWQPGVDFRKLFRASQGHLLLCQLVAEAQPPIWPAVTTMATAYRNVMQDSEPGQVTVQQVQLLASVLPPASATSKPTQPQQVRRPADQQAAVIAALFSALRRNPSPVAEELFRCGAVANLVHISRNPGGNTAKVVSFADALLAFLATSGDGTAYRNRLRDEFSWSGPHGKQGQKSSTAAGGSAQKKSGAGAASNSGRRPAATGGSASAGGGAGISINVTTTDGGHENDAFQPNTMEMRGGAHAEPQYAQINKGDKQRYDYNTTTTTTTRTVMQETQPPQYQDEHELQQQQQQQQQQYYFQQQHHQDIADSAV